MKWENLKNLLPWKREGVIKTESPAAVERNAKREAVRAALAEITGHKLEDVTDSMRFEVLFNKVAPHDACMQLMMRGYFGKRTGGALVINSSFDTVKSLLDQIV